MIVQSQFDQAQIPLQRPGGSFPAAQNRSQRPQSTGKLLERGDVALLIALSILGVSFVSPQISVVAAMAATAYLILRADPQTLPAIYVLQLSASDFQLAGYRSYEYWVSRFEDLTVIVGGFPVTPNYMLLAAVTARVVYELIVRSATYRIAGSLLFFVAWVLSLVPAAASTLDAFEAKTPAWTGPIRLAILTGCYLYGQVLWANRSKKTEDFLLTRFLAIWCVLYGLSCLDFCWQRTLFVFLGFVPCMVVLALRSERRAVQLLGLATLLPATVYALGLAGISDVKSAVHGGVATTTTLIGMFAAGTLLAVAGYRASRAYRPMSAYLAGVVASALIVIVPFYVGLTYEEKRTGENWRDQELTLVDRVFYKLFDERGPIWQGAIQDISIPPYIVREYNRPFYANFQGYGLRRVPFGSHNTVLEELRLNGFGTGVLAVLTIMSGVTIGFLARAVPGSGFMHAWAAGVITAGTVAVTASSFMTDITNGFWFFAGAGMIRYWWATNRRQSAATAGRTASPSTVPGSR